MLFNEFIHNFFSKEVCVISELYVSHGYGNTRIVVNKSIMFNLETGIHN